MKYRIFIFILILIVGTVFFFNFYEYIFARNIQGTVIGMERVTQPSAIIGSRNPIDPNLLYSFAVAIKDTKTGEIFTASSEDRQWAVVQKGQCAKAKFFPYPPWNLDRADTYHNARLIQLYECP